MYSKFLNPSDLLERDEQAWFFHDFDKCLFTFVSQFGGNFILTVSNSVSIYTQLLPILKQCHQKRVVGLYKKRDSSYCN